MNNDILLDKDSHDIDISRGAPILIISNQEEVAQRLKIALLLRRGEWIFNIQDGVPYITSFLNQKNSKTNIDQFMISYISNVDGVNKVIGYDSVINKSRQLQITVKVSTDAGNIIEVQI